MRYLLLVLTFISSTALAAVAPAAEEVNPILPGLTLPSFVAQNAEGKTLSFDEKSYQRPAIFIFYRGGWCPFCNMYWAELRKYDEQLKALNMDLYFVSADSVAMLADSLDGEPKHYQLVSDGEGKVAQAFGVAFKVDDRTYQKYLEWDINLEESSGSKSHILPAPAAFIVGTDGKVKFSFVNPDYKVRLHPEVLITAAKHMVDYKIELKK